MGWEEVSANPALVTFLRVVCGFELVLWIKLFEACAIIVAATRWLLRRPPLDEPRPAVLRRRRRRLARDLESGGGTPPACDSAGAVRPQQQQREEGEEEGEEEVVEVHHITNQPTAGAESDAWRTLRPYLRQWGDGALSATTLWNPEYRHMVAPGVGSVAYVIYKAYWRTVVLAVSDPLCAPADHEAMARAFLQAFPHAMWVHVTEPFARILKDSMGYNINDIGAETTLDVTRFAYNKKTRTIKNGARDARAAGVRVREVTQAELTPDVRAALAEVTGGWLESKVGDQELAVFVRAHDYVNLSLTDGTRLLVAENAATVAARLNEAQAAKGLPVPPAKGGKKAAGGQGNSTGGATPFAAHAAASAVPVAAGSEVASEEAGGSGRVGGLDGFVLLDPIWSGGRVTGYVISLNRMRPGAHSGTLKLLYDEVMGLMKKEGVPNLAFGLAPYFNMQTDKFRGTWWSEMTFRFWYHVGTCLYDFQNLAFSKSRYGGGVEGDAYANPAVSMSHVYLACRAWWLPDLTCLDLYVFLMGLGFVKSVGDMYWRMLQGGKGAAPARGGSQLASKASMRLATSASSTSLASMASAASEEGAALKVVAVEASGR